MRDDLRLAARLGLLVLDCPGLEGGAQLDGDVLRYDPDLPACQRCLAVCREIRRSLPCETTARRKKITR